MKKSRQHAERKGRIAETIASTLLTFKGYRILERRSRNYAGEIDIIARKNKKIIFVEVKARKTHDAALEAVPAKTRRRIEKASQLWLAQYNEYYHFENRFDIISVAGWSIMHTRDAWRMFD